MQIDDQYRKCVCFLLWEGRHPQTGEFGKWLAGTGFFVALTLPDLPDRLRVYIVTARHVIQGAQAKGSIYARINTADGGAGDLPCPDDTWTLNPDTDLAVAPVKGSLNADWRWIPEDHFATEDFLREYDVGTGDNVYFAGLFSEFPGMTKNQPILRFGQISLMPDEPVLIQKDVWDEDSKQPVEAYLVECRSWGGHSGSPAFIHWPAPAPGAVANIQPPQAHFLGVVHGHFRANEDVAFYGDLSSFGTGKVPMNMGVSVLIPAKEVLKMLNQDKFRKDRQQLADKLKAKETVPALDDTVKPATPAGTLTKEEFDEALSRTTRRVAPDPTSPPPDQA